MYIYFIQFFQSEHRHPFCTYRAIQPWCTWKYPCFKYLSKRGIWWYGSLGAGKKKLKRLCYEFVFLCIFNC